MNKDKFRQLLEEFAEVKDKVPEGYRGKYPEEYEVYKQDDKYVKISRADNPTLGIEVTKLKDHFTVCELDCGQVVKNQIIEKQRMAYPEPHWRIKCRNCQNCIHPSGKGFCKQNTFQAEMNKFFNNKDK